MDMRFERAGSRGRSGWTFFTRVTELLVFRRMQEAELCINVAIDFPRFQRNYKSSRRNDEGQE